MLVTSAVKEKKKEESGWGVNEYLLCNKSPQNSMVKAVSIYFLLIGLRVNCS